jgi:hypothetical protein
VIQEVLTVRREAERFLRETFFGPSPQTAPERLSSLRPRPEDVAEVFGASAPAARAHYDRLWSGVTLADLSPRPGQTELDVYAAEALTLGTENPVSEQFPGGMREAAHHFAPHQIFVHYRFHAPNDPMGYTLTGLVRTADGRFVLFPKPWRVFDAA